MTVRGYKWLLGLTLCLLALVTWRFVALYRQMMNAALISFQCEWTEKTHLHPPELDPESLVFHLEYLQSYYQSHTNALTLRPLVKMCERDYHQTAEKLMDLLRKQSTNDFGADPQKWIDFYASNHSAAAEPGAAPNSR